MMSMANTALLGCGRPSARPYLPRLSSRSLTTLSCRDTPSLVASHVSGSALSERSPTTAPDHVSRCESRIHSSVERMVRVNHAGERAAKMMNTGRTIACGRRLRKDRSKVHGEVHTNSFEEEIWKKRVRPSLLLPLWDMAGFVCGVGSAVLGNKAPANSVIHTVISDHYNSQLRELLATDISDVKLLEAIRKCRDSFEEASETGMDSHSDKLLQIDTVTQLMRNGCKLALWLAERV